MRRVGWFLVSTWLQTLLIILLLLPAERNGDDVQNQMRVDSFCASCKRGEAVESENRRLERAVMMARHDVRLSRA